MCKQWKQWQTLFSWPPKSLQMVTAAMKLKAPCSLEEKLWPLDIILKSRDITLPTKVHLVKAMVFPVVMYGCESWTIKKAECRRIDAFELWCWRRLESSWDCHEIKPVNPKGNQSWIFIGRTDDEAEAPILWLPNAKSWLLGKDPDAGRDWRREEKGMTEMRWLDGNTNLMDMSLSNYRNWWWTGRPGVLQSTGLQRVGDDWATELNWTSRRKSCISLIIIGWRIFHFFPHHNLRK